MRNKNVKTTFASIADMKGVSVSDRVRDFSKMKECMISSGYCNYHNVRVKREVSVKKMSTADKNGEVRWVMGEVTILVCPLAPKPNVITSEAENTVSILPEVGENPTNKRLRNTCDMEMNQSTDRNTGLEM